MIFWIIAGVLSLLAIAMVLLPVFRSPKQGVEKTGHDRAIYQARLEEIDRDLELGRIGQSEAEAARAEEARRLIQANDKHANDKKTANASPLGDSSFLLAIVAVALFVPLASLLVYSLAGEPQYSDQQLAERQKLSPDQQNIEGLLAKAETHLAANPDDVRGWEVVAPIYMRLGRYGDAAKAYSNLLRLKGDDPQRLADLAETLIYQSNGMITSDAEGLLDKALKLDPKANKARFYSALALQQQNRFDEAKLAWNAIIADNGDNEQMVAVARQQLAMMEPNAEKEGGENAGGENAEGANSDAPGNPTAEQMQDAAKMDAGSRTAMIEGMVAQLREKLKEDPTNKQGWVRLFRSYKVLGKNEETLSALAEARAAFANDPEFMEYLAGIEAQMNKGARAGGQTQKGSESPEGSKGLK